MVWHRAVPGIAPSHLRRSNVRERCDYRDTGDDDFCRPNRANRRLELISRQPMEPEGKIKRRRALPYLDRL